MEQARQESGRINQKRRTRAAIVDAAAELLRQGQTPTVAQVADAAAVSRATAYRYFPSQDYLLSEAALDGVREQIEGLLAAADSSSEPASRVDALVQTSQERIAAREAGFRALLRLSLEQPFDGDGEDASHSGRRGGRRMDWIEAALAPVWDRLDEPAKDHLTGALSLCMGIEALVVLRDICGYSPEEAIEICRWAAQAILRAGLQAFDPMAPDGS